MKSIPGPSRKFEPMHLETVHTFFGNPARQMAQAPSEAILDSQVDERPVTNKATHRILSGNRLYLQHGPIDLVIVADAPEYVQAQAFSLAISSPFESTAITARLR